MTSAAGAYASGASSPSIVFFHPGETNRKESQRWVTPGLSDSASLQDHVLDTASGQRGTRCQPRRPATHDHTVDHLLPPCVTEHHHEYAPTDV